MEIHLKILNVRVTSYYIRGNKISHPISKASTKRGNFTNHHHPKNTCSHLIGTQVPFLCLLGHYLLQMRSSQTPTVKVRKTNLKNPLAHLKFWGCFSKISGRPRPIVNTKQNFRCFLLFKNWNVKIVKKKILVQKVMFFLWVWPVIRNLMKCNMLESQICHF